MIHPVEICVAPRCCREPFFSGIVGEQINLTFGVGGAYAEAIHILWIEGHEEILDGRIVYQKAAAGMSTAAALLSSFRATQSSLRQVSETVVVKGGGHFPQDGRARFQKSLVHLFETILYHLLDSTRNFRKRSIAQPGPGQTEEGRIHDLSVGGNLEVDFLVF